MVGGQGRLQRCVPSQRGWPSHVCLLAAAATSHAAAQQQPRPSTQSPTPSSQPGAHLSRKRSVTSTCCATLRMRGRLLPCRRAGRRAAAAAGGPATVGACGSLSTRLFLPRCLSTGGLTTLKQLQQYASCSTNPAPTLKLEALMYSYRLMLSSSQVMHRWPLQDRTGRGRAGQGREAQAVKGAEWRVGRDSASGACPAALCRCSCRRCCRCC